MDLFICFSILAIVAVFLLMYFSIISNITNPINVKLPPGKLGWPIIGEILDFFMSSRNGHPERFISNRTNNFSSDIFKTSLIGEKMAVLCGPSGNKFVFSNENKLVKSWIPHSVQKILLSEINSTLGSEEMAMWRNIFFESLKPEVVKKYIHAIDHSTKQHLEDEWASNQTLKVHPLTKKFTFALSCKLFLGIEDPTDMAKLADQFVLVNAGLFSLPVDIPGTPFSNAVKAAKVIRGELRKIVRQKRLYLSEKEDSETSRNMLSRSLAETNKRGKFASDNDIASSILGFLVASHETSSSLLTNLVYYLADNPQVYSKVLREQNEIAKLKGAEKLLSWEDTNRMKYSRNVMNEVLRIASPSQGFFREALHDITYTNFTIPKGWKIYWSVNSTHKDPKYFPNPEKFDPTRFEGDGPVPFTFTPFGGGPRMCPGNEFARQVVLVFMHNLVRKYSWEKLIPNEKIRFDQGLAAPVNGLPIKIKPHRDQAVE
ncbi:unnamed protein product [Fraxinus pennsylvanica]|uniref:Cytochrome P450 n=1 Tax=Fraxinus pennsylvanica TaxID=56036 RepID=A0AAD1ZER1_9LAMI|nr:unnamed protein product [Fraxinus pennsylvanica]